AIIPTCILRVDSAMEVARHSGRFADDPGDRLMSSHVLQAASQTCDTLKGWLLDEAYTRWWSNGADLVRGGFHERLNLDGTPREEPRRARVNPRQVYCYNLADDLGWQGPSQQAVQHGLEYFLRHYRR